MTRRATRIRMVAILCLAFAGAALENRAPAAGDTPDSVIDVAQQAGSSTKAASPRTSPQRTFRVIVDTDLGGDPDDIQSLFRLIHYSDILKVEAIVSSPGPGSEPRTSLIKHWIQRVDVDHLRSRGFPELMTEEQLVQAVVPGSRDSGAPTSDRQSEGSRQIIRCAQRDLDEPVWVLVWGSMTSLAQATSRRSFHRVSIANLQHRFVQHRRRPCQSRLRIQLHERRLSFVVVDRKRHPPAWLYGYVSRGLPRGKPRRTMGQSGIHSDTYSRTRLEPSGLVCRTSR